MIERLLEQATAVADQAEVFWATSRSQPVSFEANRLKSVEARESTGVALRIVRDGRIGFSSTTHPEDIDRLVERALEMLPFGARAAMVLPGPDEYPDVPVFDQGTEDLSVEQMVDLGRGTVEVMRERWPEALWDARLSRSVSTVRVLNSHGCYVEGTRSVFGMGVEGTVVRGTDMLFVWEGQSSCRPMMDTADLVAGLDRGLRWAERVVPAPKGQVPVIFTPRGLAGLLLGPLLAGFNGRNIVQGSSPLVDRLGEELLDPRLTLWNDPHLPYVPGSRPWDDEGVRAQRFPLVDRGVVSRFLYDLQTAGQAGTTSTGSAHRSLGTQPGPGPSVVVVEPGETPFEEIIAGQRDALIVESFLGAGQGNVLGGDFSANVLLGYRVVNGEVVGRVKDTMVAGNVYTALRHVGALGSDPQWVGGSLCAPAIECNGVTVSSKE